MKISIEAIKQVLRVEDIEGLIEIHGAPEDEYDDEAEEIFEEIKIFNKKEIDEVKLIEIISDVWQRMFDLDEKEIEPRIEHIKSVAQEIMKWL